MRLPRLCTPLLFVGALLAGLFAVSSIAAAQNQPNSGAKPRAHRVRTITAD